MNPISSPGEETAVFQMVIHNEASEVVRLSQWLNETIVPALQLSAKLAFRLDLILEEALTNILDHAFDTAAPQQIIVNLDATTDTVSVQVIDEGKPFDPLAEHQVQLPATLDESGHGGLGLHLIRSYAQTCHYQRTDRQNIFTIILDRHLN